ncbi:hypothetical protein F8M41_015782 [Gigaspora margarita]|uniref:Nudix hydrolase domain-containing protein n=1 Tax=Gigaspora margarita TaxID=4874 RepID=A0A8H4AQ45_GIGMA|nr:hypothetical protein F8M41_015782 [Gigaspora margarita]
MDRFMDRSWTTVQSAITQEYNTAIKKFKGLSEYNSKYLSFLNSLNSIKKYGFSGDFSNTEQQIRTQIDMNINLMQQKKPIIDKYEEEIRSFLICLLVTPDRQAWLNYCINSNKDYYNYDQSVCRIKENNETFEECAIQKTKEEANIEIKELNFINVHNRFRNFQIEKSVYSKYLFIIHLLIKFLKIEENDDKDNHSIVSTLSKKEDIKTEDKIRWKITNQKIRY